MSDDKIEAKLAAGGYPGWIQNLWSRLTGKGEQSIPARKELLTTMEDIAQNRAVRLDKNRDWYAKVGEESGFKKGRILRDRPEIVPLTFDKNDIQVQTQSKPANWPGTDADWEEYLRLQDKYPKR